MRFRSSESGLSGSKLPDQKKILRIVGAVAICLVLFNLVILPRLRPPANDGKEKQPTLRDVDFGVRDNASPPLRPGEFRAVAPSKTVGGGASPLTGGGVSRLQIDPALLKNVEDNTLGVRARELPAYYSILRQLSETKTGSLSALVRKDASFTTLMVTPERYRGDVVTITGEVRGVTPIVVDPTFEIPDGEEGEGKRRINVAETYGIKALYDVWMFTKDSENNPYHVVTTSIPEGLPVGEFLRERYTVTVTGVFLKKTGYAARSRPVPEGGAPSVDEVDAIPRLRTAPLILAGGMRLLAKEKDPFEPNIALAKYVAWTVSILAIVFGFIAWRLRLADREFGQKYVHRTNRTASSSMASIGPVEAVDPVEALRQLAADDLAKGRSDSGSDQDDDATLG